MAQNLTQAQKAGKKLKNLIKESEYTQERFAIEVMFVDPTTVRRWISKGIDSISTLEQIAKIFDIDFLELFK